MIRNACLFTVLVLVAAAIFGLTFAPATGQTTAARPASTTRPVRATRPVPATTSAPTLVATRVLLAEANLPPPPEPTLFVDGANPAASDQNPGTKDKPWKTLAKAAAAAKAGDVVLVAEGTYDERVSPANSGEKGKLVTFLAKGKAVTRGFVLKKDYIRVRGFTVFTEQKKGTPYEHGFDCTASGCEMLGNLLDHPNGFGANIGGAGNLFRGNTIRYADGIGIVLSGKDNVAEYNDVSHSIKVRAGDADATRFFGSGHVIRGNYLHDITHAEAPGAHVDAFQTYDSGGPVQNILIENNFCYNLAAQMLMAEGTKLKKSEGITLRNNVFHTVGAIAINVHGIRNMRVYNNLFIGGQWVAIRLRDGCTGSQVYNNIVVGIDPVQVDASSKEGTTADYNMTSLAAGKEPNPLIGPHDIFGKTPAFVDPQKMNFHLKAGSPGAGAGMDLSQQGGFSADKDGAPRPSGKGWDMGPYQGEGK